jgi:hypothetical protein
LAPYRDAARQSTRLANAAALADVLHHTQVADAGLDQLKELTKPQSLD